MNKKAMIAAIKADGALCAGSLVNGRVPGCGHAGRCAVGALLFHGGMTNKELKQVTSCAWEYAHAHENDNDLLVKGRKIFAKHYGMTSAEMKKVLDGLIRCNDRFNGAWDDMREEETGKSLKQWQARAKAVIKYIRSL